MVESKSSKLLESLRESQSLDELRGGFTELCEYYNMDRFIFVNCPSNGTVLNVETTNNFPQGLIEFYLQSNYHPHDPRYYNRGRIHVPFSWDLKWMSSFGPIQKEFSSCSYDFSIKYGTLLPSLPYDHGQMFLNVLDHTNINPSTLHMLSIGLILYEERKAYLARNEKIKLLTSREKEILNLYSKGFTWKAIAKPLGITENTVAFHLKNLRQKLGVHSSAQALFIYNSLPTKP